MTTQPARGPRSWGLRLLVLGSAIVVGLLLQQVVAARLAEIQTLAATDFVAARRELALLLQVVAGGALVLTAVAGVALALAGRRALALEVFPPPGAWSWGATRTVTGPRARTFARIAIGLAVALVLCSLAGLGLVFYVVRVLIECRAG